MSIQFTPAKRPIDLPTPAWVYEQRILNRVEVDDNGCWVWTGPLNAGGYGSTVRAWHRAWLAHRLAYTVMVGPIPPALQIDHTCRRRPCVSPFHLEAVTQLENLRRQGTAVFFCPAGHEYTPENTYRGPASPNMRRCRRCAYLRQLKAVA